MTFKRIGDVAARLIADPAKLQAAANEAPRKGGSEPSTRGRERPDPLPRLNADGSASNTRNGKRTGAETPASDARGNVRQTTASLEVVASVASPPVGRSIVMVSRAVAPRKRQAPKVSAMIIDLAIWRAVHCPPAHAAKSGSARANSPKAKTMIQSLLSENALIVPSP